jgi:hypothetical protein
MLPFINVALQALLGGGIHAAGLAGAQATAVNLAGQAVIHGLAVAAGPIGLIATGLVTAGTFIYCMSGTESFGRCTCDELLSLVRVATRLDEVLAGPHIGNEPEIRRVLSEYYDKVDKLSGKIPPELFEKLRQPANPEVQERERFRLEAQRNHTDVVKGRLRCR